MASPKIKLAKSPNPILSKQFDKIGLQYRSFALNAVLERAALYASADARIMFGTQHILEAMLSASDEEQTRLLPTFRGCGMDTSDFEFKGDKNRHLEAALRIEEAPHEVSIQPDYHAGRILRAAKGLAASSGAPAIDTVHVFRAMVADEKHPVSRDLDKWLDAEDVTETLLIATSRRLDEWECSLDTLPMTHLGHVGAQRGSPPIPVIIGGKGADTAHMANQRRLGGIIGVTPKLELFTPLGLDITRWFMLRQVFVFCLGTALLLGVVEIFRGGHPWWVIFGLILACWDTASAHWSVRWVFRLASTMILVFGALYPWLGLVVLASCYAALNNWLVLLVQRRETRNPDYDQAQLTLDSVWAVFGSFRTNSK